MLFRPARSLLPFLVGNSTNHRRLCLQLTICLLFYRLWLLCSTKSDTYFAAANLYWAAVCCVNCTFMIFFAYYICHSIGLSGILVRMPIVQHDYITHDNKTRTFASQHQLHKVVRLVALFTSGSNTVQPRAAHTYPFRVPNDGALATHHRASFNGCRR